MSGTEHANEHSAHLAEIAARFDSRSVDYDRNPMHRALAAAVAEFARLDEVDAVLDVATGTGLVLRALPADPGRELFGVDISDGMLSVARSALPTARFVHADAEELPFDDAEFDLITCVTGLHLLERPEAALAQWRRVLRPRGRIVVAVFRADESDGIRMAPGAHGPMSERHFAFGSVDALARFAATADLHLSRHTGWSFPEPADECLIAEFAPN